MGRGQPRARLPMLDYLGLSTDDEIAGIFHGMF
jgi:hypothetical protein